MTRLFGKKCSTKSLSSSEGLFELEKKKMADALSNAVEENDVVLVKELIGKGADVNGVDRNGWTALHWAVWRGFAGCTRVLLESNADVDKANHSGATPLHRALNIGHVECVKVWWWCGTFSLYG